MSGENSPNWITGYNVYRRLLKKYGKAEKCSICGIVDKRVLVFITAIPTGRTISLITLNGFVEIAIV